MKLFIIQGSRKPEKKLFQLIVIGNKTQVWKKRIISFYFWQTIGKHWEEKSAKTLITVAVCPLTA